MPDAWTFSKNGDTIVYVPKGLEDEMEDGLEEYGAREVEIRYFYPSEFE